MTSATDYGTLEKTATGGRLSFVREFNHPREKVWRAVTEPEHLAVWFPTSIDGERAVGADLTFKFPFPDAPVIDGKMLAFDPPNMFELVWGLDTLRITLEATDDGAGTRLTLTDTFDEYAKAARDAAGWHACLDRLVCHQDGAEWTYGDDGRWKEVSPWYLANFPADAITASIPDFHPESANS